MAAIDRLRGKTIQRRDVPVYFDVGHFNSIRGCFLKVIEINLQSQEAVLELLKDTPALRAGEIIRIPTALLTHNYFVLPVFALTDASFTNVQFWASDDRDVYYLAGLEMVLSDGEENITLYLENIEVARNREDESYVRITGGLVTGRSVIPLEEALEKEGFSEAFNPALFYFLNKAALAALQFELAKK